MFSQLKTLAFILTSALLLICANVRAGTTIPIEGKHTMYFLSSSSNCVISTLSDDDLPVYFKSALKGESVTFKSGEEEDFLKRFNVAEVFTEKIGSVSNKYYYSAKIPFYKLINGQKVNIHVSRCGDLATIGIPFIFGSY